jgi:hypothetical protein
MADADRGELQDRLRQWEEDVGRRNRGPDERGSGKADPKDPRKPGEPELFTRQRAFEEEFAAIQVRRFRLHPPELPPESSPEPTVGPSAPPTVDPSDAPTARPNMALRNDLDVSSSVRLRKYLERLFRRGG